jgi:hypothetical protein
MRTKIVNGHEVTWDGRTVWVNSGVDGKSLARFSKVGIDVHKPSAEQVFAGNPCIACFHRDGDAMTQEDWQTFQRLMVEHHQTAVPNKAQPDYLKREAPDG